MHASAFAIDSMYSNACMCVPIHLKLFRNMPMLFNASQCISSISMHLSDFFKCIQTHSNLLVEFLRRSMHFNWPTAFQCMSMHVNAFECIALQFNVFNAFQCISCISMHLMHINECFMHFDVLTYV